jgi:ATP-dependent helicase HrpB
LLPIETVSPEVVKNLALSNVILVAPPGAGKSTFLPLQLLAMAAFSNQTIIMLQPRRVAVRAIADYLASQLGESVGQTVGYKIRGEAKTSQQTRLLIVTEGLLARLIQADPELPNVALIVFDEFHERNIHADLSLALCLDVQQTLRDDLRLLVMSATLEAQGLTRLMPDAKLIQSEGKQFPVTTFYHPISNIYHLSQEVAVLTCQILNKHQGSILVFLPGARDINHVFDLLTHSVDKDTKVFRLYGALTKQQQLEALKFTEPGKRKVVLATNIAETSLTIDGISTVIDSGLEKVSRFNLKRGISQLVQQPISQASSIQRQGRAGRLGPGQCYRLWAEEKQSRLAAHSTPEIFEQDICSLLLTTLVWGSQLQDLALLDLPSVAQISQAQSLLQSLGAINSQNKLTELGRQMAQFGCHPRLANMLLKSSKLSSTGSALACVICAFLERETRLDKTSTRLSNQLDALKKQPQHPIWMMAKQWAKRLKIQNFSVHLEINHELVALLVGFAFPDQIARNRGKGRFLLVNGGGANLSAQDSLMESQWLAIAQMQLADKADAMIQLAEPIELAVVKHHFDNMLTEQDEVEWQEKEQRVIAQKVQTLGAIVLQTAPLSHISDDKYADIWLQLIRTKGLKSLMWGKDVKHWLGKVALARQYFGETWPDLSDASLTDSLEQWMLPYLGNIKSWKALQQLNWLEILQNHLDWNLQSQLLKLFPKRIKVPTGNQYSLDYSADGSVNLSVKMQEMYGLTTTPTVANGKIAVVITLLSPAGRPLQKTQDLAGFWQGSYKDVQKEMKGRYPKHFWPDDPTSAQPTSRVKSKM